MKEILNVIHNTIYQFFDVCSDDEEVPISDKDKLLLEVNKAICNNLKALEQESCEDAVSRKAVSDALESIGSLDTEADRKYARSVFEALPLVALQPKIGRWIGCDILQGFKCSECRVCFRNKSNYCPNCGRRMESEVEE